MLNVIVKLIYNTVLWLVFIIMTFVFINFSDRVLMVRQVNVDSLVQ